MHLKGKLRVVFQRECSLVTFQSSLSTPRQRGRGFGRESAKPSEALTPHLGTLGTHRAWALLFGHGWVAGGVGG